LATFTMPGGVGRDAAPLKAVEGLRGSWRGLEQSREWRQARAGVRGWVRALELTRSEALGRWHAHLHVVLVFEGEQALREWMAAWPIILARWEALGGGYVADVRRWRPGPGKHYLAKGSKWTLPDGIRPVTWSRGWPELPEEDDEGWRAWIAVGRRGTQWARWSRGGGVEPLQDERELLDALRGLRTEALRLRARDGPVDKLSRWLRRGDLPPDVRAAIEALLSTYAAAEGCCAAAHGLLSSRP